jgi:hypothetical protein
MTIGHVNEAVSLASHESYPGSHRLGGRGAPISLLALRVPQVLKSRQDPIKEPRLEEPNSIEGMKAGNPIENHRDFDLPYPNTPTPPLAWVVCAAMRLLSGECWRLHEFFVKKPQKLGLATLYSSLSHPSASSGQN